MSFWERDPVADASAASPAAKPAAPAPKNFWERDPVAADTGMRPDMAEGMQRLAREKRGVKDIGTGEAAATGAVNWLALGTWGDELMGGASAAASYLTHPDSEASLKQRYDHYRQNWQDRSDAAWEQHPYAYGAGAVGGGLTSALLSPVVKGGSALATGAKTGAVYGGLAGAGEGDGLTERGINSLIGAGVGGVLGGALGKGAEAIGDKLFERDIAKAATNSIADRAQAEAGALPVPMVLPRGNATGDVETQAVQNLMADVGMGGGAARVAKARTNELYDQLGQNVDVINRRLAGADAAGLPHPQIRQAEEAGDLLKSSIEGRTRQLRDTAGAVADDIGLRLGNGANLADDEYAAARGAAEAVRSRAAVEKAANAAQYERAFNTPGEFAPEAIDGIDHWIKRSLTYDTAPDGSLVPRARPVEVTVNTPNAQQALSLLGDQGNFRAPVNKADPRGAPRPDAPRPISLKEVDTVWKRLGSLYSGAQGEDRRAMGAILRGYQDHLERSVTDGLFSGDPEFLRNLQEARQGYASWVQKWRPDHGRPGAKIMRDIIERNADEVKTANLLFGKAMIGDKAAASDAALHLVQTLGVDSPEVQAIKQAGWRLMTRHEGNLTPQVAQQIAARIEDFTTRQGRVVAEALYTAEQRRWMQQFAGHMRAIGGTKNAPPTDVALLMKIADGDLSTADIAARFAGTGNNPGTSTSAWHLMGAIRSRFGVESPELSAAKQAIFRQATTMPEGMNPKGFELLANNLDKLVSGRARRLTQEYFGPEVTQMMTDLSRTARRLAGAAEAKNPPKTAPRLLQGLQNQWSTILGLLGVASVDASTGAGLYLTAKAGQAAKNYANKRSAQKLFSGQEAPSVMKRLGDRSVRGVQRGAERAQPLTRYGHEMAPSGGAMAEDGE